MPAVGVISRLVTHPQNGAAVTPDGSATTTTTTNHATTRPAATTSNHHTNGAGGHGGGGGGGDGGPTVHHQPNRANVAVPSAWQETTPAPSNGTAANNPFANVTAQLGGHHNNNNNYHNKFRHSYPPPVDPQSQQMSAYRRWLSKNRVGQSQPSSFQTARNAAASAAVAGANGKLLRDVRNNVPKYQESPGAAAILYLGLGMIAVGLVITIVGLGDDVFKTLALQLIGPTMMCVGVVVVAIRVMVCFCCADRCQLCDRPIEYPDTRLKSASLKSWRPDSRSVVKDKTARSSVASSAGSATSRRPPSARVTLERGEQKVVNMAAASGSQGRPIFTSPTPSFQDFSTSTSSSSPDQSIALSSLHSDDIGELLNEFKEIELQRADPHLQKGADSRLQKRSDAHLQRGTDSGKVEQRQHSVPPNNAPTDPFLDADATPNSSAGPAPHPPVPSCRPSSNTLDKANSPWPDEPTKIHDRPVPSAPEETSLSPELEVQRFLQMELQKVFEFDFPAFTVVPARVQEDRPLTKPLLQEKFAKVVEPAAVLRLVETGNSSVDRKDSDEVGQQIETEVLRADTEMERYLTETARDNAPHETDVEEILRNTDAQLVRSRGNTGKLARETEQKIILQTTDEDNANHQKDTKKTHSETPLQESHVQKVPQNAQTKNVRQVAVNTFQEKEQELMDSVLTQEAQLQRVLQSEELGKVLKDAKLSKVPLKLGQESTNGHIQSPQASAQVRSSPQLVTATNDTAGRDLSAGILLNPSSLMQNSSDDNRANR